MLYVIYQRANQHTTEKEKDYARTSDNEGHQSI